MALGFKKPSSQTLENVGMLGGMGLAALGGPIAPLILASLYSAQKGTQRADAEEEALRQRQENFLAGQQPAPEYPGFVGQTRGFTPQEDRREAAALFPQAMAEQRLGQMFPQPMAPKDRYTNVPGVGLVDLAGDNPRTVIEQPRADTPLGGATWFMDKTRPNGKAFMAFPGAPGVRARIERGEWVPTQEPQRAQPGTRPATAQEKAAYGIPESAGVAIDLTNGKPVILTQPKQDAPTESQSNAAFNAGRIADALATVGKIIETDPDASTSAVLEGTEGVPFLAPIGRKIASPNQEIFRNNMTDAIDAVITLGTGAAYTGEQKIAARNAYLPQTGESQEAKDEKYRKFISVYGLAREKARAAGKDLPDPAIFQKMFEQKAATPQPQQPPAGRIVTQNGWRYEIGADGNAKPIGPVTK